jgi:O-antigen biosynthesis protein
VYSVIEPATINDIANVSVTISTCDRADALARCLDALLCGEVLPSEIVVVDQSRSNQTRTVVEQRQSGPVPIHYIRDAGVGLGASQNIAIAHTSCPIVAVTDDDCVPMPDWIAVIAQAFAAPDLIDVVTGRVLPLGPDTPGLYAVSSRTSLLRTEFGPNAMPWDIGSGNNFAAKRDWLNRIGGNDERLGPGSPGQGGVDMDLFYRLLRAGARIRYEPSSLVYHERASKAGRIGRRAPYGFGIGAGCSIRLREGDRQALRILGRWLLMRVERLAGALRRRQWMLAYEEVLVLGGTLGGLVHGLRAGDAVQVADTPSDAV